MAFFPDVSPGQDFVPSALLSNNVRRIVNSLNGHRGKGLDAMGAGTVRIQIYNALENALEAGTAVNFPGEGVFCDGAVPAIALADPGRPWGVVTQRLSPAEMGDCIISGPVMVSVTGNGDFAQPVPETPGVFTRGAKGAPVLFAHGSKAVINLGAGTPEYYDGPFALTYDAEKKKLIVKAGYLSRNGEFLLVAEKELEPATGSVCVTTALDANGAWSTPDIVFGSPGTFFYPVGSCKVEGSGHAECQCVFLPGAGCDFHRHGHLR